MAAAATHTPEQIQFYCLDFGGGTLASLAGLPHLIIARRSGGASRAMFDKVLAMMKDLSADALLMSAPKDEGKILDGIPSAKLPPGRGTLVSRSRENEMVQITYVPIQ